jgi:hypothetical protein
LKCLDLYNINSTVFLPPGGATGQVLQKGSGTDYDAVWVTPVSTSEGIWNFATNNTMADPGSGKFRTNTTAFSTATAIAISNITSQNVDRTNLLTELKSGDIVTIQDKANAANFARYTVGAPATNNTTWFQIPVSWVTGGGTAPNNNSQCAFTFELASGPTGGGTVASVFGRTGAVVAAANDYNFNQLAGSATAAQGGLPTGGTANQVLAKIDGTNYNAQWISRALILLNASTAAQSPGASDVYIAGSNIVVGAGVWAAGGVYHCHFDIAKTGGTTAHRHSFNSDRDGSHDKF